MDMCRICLSNSADQDIQKLKSNVDGAPKNSVDILDFCLNIKIEDLTVNMKLCAICFKKVLSFYEFKCLALKNDTYLKTVVFPDNKNEVFFKVDIKIEDLNGNDSLGGFPSDVKEELFDEEDALQDYHSDDELLSVIKQMKYENNEEDEVKENNVTLPNEKKKGKVQKPKSESNTLQVCEECGKTVRRMREHRLLHQPPSNRRRYECKDCNKIFSSYGARYKHVKIKHLGMKQKCPICNKAVVNLKSHELSMHKTSLLPHACLLCERRFLSQSLLDIHMSSHTKDRPYQCELCEKAFKTKMVMLQHRRQVHDKEKMHLCQFCSKSFFKKSHLHSHIRSHTKEKPYECKDCGKHFSTITVLRNHMTTHSNLKLFQCSMCDMSFARRSYLKVHMVIHTKEKRHECKYCGVRFGRSDHRNRHQLTIHEQYRQPYKLTDFAFLHDRSKDRVN
ncbi:zinc finger protein 883 [Amyelois transitella]|uniref:zinc finger protein 883 n=1 Tax=Amyelois transitella TaxID=680683 RepID=UPI00067B8934|nr:zinc finger protein 883 [Amyelois transitella]